MKKHVLMALTMVSLIVTVAVTSASPQSGPHYMRVAIPFEFAVRDKTLPPGEYMVRRLSSDEPGGLLISSTDGGPGVYVLTGNVRAETRRSRSALVFHRYGEKYFLSQVWEAGDGVGNQLSKSRRERATERELAKDTTGRQTVTLIAHQR